MTHIPHSHGFSHSFFREHRLMFFANPEKNDKQPQPLSENAQKLINELLTKGTNKQEIADEIRRTLMADGEINKENFARHVSAIHKRLTDVPSFDVATGKEIKEAVAALPGTPEEIVNFAVEQGMFTTAELLAAQRQGILRSQRTSPARKATQGRMSPGTAVEQQPRSRMSYDEKTKTITWPDGTTMSMDQYREFSQAKFRMQDEMNRPTGPDKNAQIMKKFNTMRGGGGDMAHDYFDRKANMQKYARVDIGHSTYFPREMNPVSRENSSLSRAVPPSADVSKEQQSSAPRLERWPENERRKFEETPKDGQWHKIEAGVKGYLYAVGKDGQLYAFNSVNKDISRFTYLPPNNTWAYVTPKAAETVAGLIAPDASTQKLATDALGKREATPQSDKIIVEHSKIEDPSERGGFSRVVKTWTTGAEKSDVSADAAPETIGTPEWFKPLYNDAKNQAAIKENAVVRRGDAWPSMPTTFVDGIYEVPSPNTRPGELPMPFVNYSGWHMPPGRFDLNGMTPEQQQQTIARLQNPYSNQEETLRLRRAGRGTGKPLPKMKSYEERPTKVETPSDEPPMMDLPPVAPKQAPAPTPPEVPESALPPAPKPTSDLPQSTPEPKLFGDEVLKGIDTIKTPETSDSPEKPKPTRRPRGIRNRTSAKEESTSPESPAETETRKSSAFELDEE